LDGGLTDRWPPVLTDLLLAFISMLFRLDTEEAMGPPGTAADSWVRHGDVSTVDRDRSRRDGGGRPEVETST
jgi:hypothetical protein